MENQKNYYAIIPATVRYDKNLCAYGKLLYGEITALCSEKGYCWATNCYFAELYGKTKETVSRWISKLEKLGYIKTEIIYQDGKKNIQERRIYIDKNVNTPKQKNQQGHDENVNTPIDENVKDNIICINNTGINTINNNTDKKSRFAEFWENYPRKKSKEKSKALFEKHERNGGVEKLFTALHNYIREIKENRIEARFVMHGATFLNGRWQDYIDWYERGNKNRMNTNTVSADIEDTGINF